MREKGLLFILCLLAATAGACAPKSYPRQATAQEKAYTSVARAVDLAGAEILPRYYPGRRYNLERQTPVVEYSYYTNIRFKRDPTSFYSEPEGLPEVEVVGTMADTKRVSIQLIKWPSQYKPQNPDFALRYERYVEEHTVYAVYVRSKRTPHRGVIIVSHAWTEGDIHMDRNWDRDKMFDYFNLGYDTVIIQQPYHGLRSLENTVFSGEQFFSGEVAMINEAMCQAVTDIRSIKAWLRPHYEVVGLMGENMGATASLMTAVVEEDVDFVIAWEPLSSLGNIQPGSPLAPFAVGTMRAVGLDQDIMNKILYVSSPANYEPAIPVKDVILFAGMGDVFVTPEQPQILEKKWDQLKVVWFAGGHLLNLQKKLCRYRETRFLIAQLPEEARPIDKNATRKELKKKRKEDKRKRRQEEKELKQKRKGDKKNRKQEKKLKKKEKEKRKKLFRRKDNKEKEPSPAP